MTRMNSQNGIIEGENRKPPAMLQTSRGRAHRRWRSAMRNHSNLSLLTIKDKQRFWSKVDKSADCWHWLASKNRMGHGWFKLRGRMHYAHRIAYASAYGDFPLGLEIHHECNNPSCVNPAHLTAMTKSDHSRLSSVSIRRASLTHCKKGHEFTEANTYKWRGSRHCKECNRLRSEKRRALK